jgi:hypothetical protein
MQRCPKQVALVHKSQFILQEPTQRRTSPKICPLSRLESALPHHYGSTQEVRATLSLSPGVHRLGYYTIDVAHIKVHRVAYITVNEIDHSATQTERPLRKGVAFCFLEG